jgi:predicted membrane protein
MKEDEMSHVEHAGRFHPPCCRKPTRKDKVRHGLFWGLALMLFGILFLLDHLGHLGGYEALNFWPLLIVMAGLSSLSRKGHRICGILLLGIGGLALMSTLSIIDIGWSLIWPVALIAVGLFVVFGVATARWRIPEHARQAGLAYGTAVMGGKEDRIDSKEFEGGDVTAVMGSYELDLSGAEIKGEEATVVAKAVMGSVEIRAASHWRISIQGNPVLGTVEDRTCEPSGDIEQQKTLIIQATAVLGSVEIRN